MTRICPAGQKATSVVFSKEWWNDLPLQAENLQHGFAVQSKIFAQTISKNIKNIEFSKIFFKNIFPKIYIFLETSQNIKFSRFSKIFFPNKNFQKLSKKFENFGIFKFGKNKYSGKKSFWLSTKKFSPICRKMSKSFVNSLPELRPKCSCPRRTPLFQRRERGCAASEKGLGGSGGAIVAGRRRRTWRGTL